MITVKELKDWAGDLKPILFDANVSLNNLVILNHENSNKFKHDHPQVYSILWHQQYFIIIVQLAKVFSTNDNTQKRNINKLCNKFKSKELSIDIKQLLQSNAGKTESKSIDDLLKIVNGIINDIEVSSSTIGRLIPLRNKVFAHTDPDSTDEEISIDELRVLVNLANEIYNSLFGNIFNDYFHPNFVLNWDIRNLIKLINQAQPGIEP